MKRSNKLPKFALGLVLYATPIVALTLTLRGTDRPDDHIRGDCKPSRITFNFSTIDPPGSLFTFPFGINPQSDIVGNYVDGGLILVVSCFRKASLRASIFRVRRPLLPAVSTLRAISLASIQPVTSRMDSCSRMATSALLITRALRPLLPLASTLRAISSAGTPIRAG